MGSGNRSYRELARIESFEERYHYLALHGEVGIATFGFDRHLNQMFYTSSEWRSARREVILRDEGCDLGVEGYEIHGRLLVHHMNPIRAEDIIHGNLEIIDPNFLIVVSHDTHNAIHYGDERLLPRPFVPRSRNDQKLWP